MAMAGLCGVCGSTDMTSGGDGFTYCNRCGSQSQNFLDEAFDYEDAHMFNARHRRDRHVARNEQMAAMESQHNLKASQQASYLGTQEDLAYLQQTDFNSQFASQLGLFPEVGTQSQAPETDQKGCADTQLGLSDSGKLAAHVRRVYVEGLQILLQMQCEVLVERLGVNPLVCGILGPVWLKFLESTCVFEKGWADEALLVAEAQHHRDPEQDEKPEQVEHGPDQKPVTSERKLKRKRKKKHLGEPWTSYGERARYVWLRNLKGRIPLRSTLAITFLVCHLAREPILPTDIINWAFEGALPYLSAHTSIEKRSTWGSQPTPASSKEMFKPLRMTNARMVEFLASLIAKRTGLQLPPVNFHMISRRFLQELDLSIESFAPYVCRLFEWFPISGLWLSSHTNSLPTRIYVMAMLVVVFKLLYKLDGSCNKKTSSKSKGNDPDMELEALKEKECVWDSKEFVTKMKNLLQNDDQYVDQQEELRAYLRYCRDVIFKGDNLSIDDEQQRDHFWELYEKFSKQDAAGKGTLEANAVRLQVERTDSAEDVSGALRGKSPSTNTEDSWRSFGSSGRENISQSRPPVFQDKDKQVFVKESSQESAKKHKCLVHVASKLSADPLKQEMEDLGFALLEPVKGLLSDDEYVHYFYSKDGKRQVHADYFIVLQACAKVINVDPRALHNGVQNVENGLVQVEKKIDKFLASRDTKPMKEPSDGVDEMEETV